jgi:hypothetical protein
MVKNRSHLWFQVVPPVYIALPQECGREFLWDFDPRIDGRNDSDEDPVSGLKVLSDNLQYARAIRFSGRREIKVPRLKLEQARQKLGVIHLRAGWLVSEVVRQMILRDFLYWFSIERR